MVAGHRDGSRSTRTPADRYLTLHIPSPLTAHRWLLAHRYLLIVHGRLTDASVPGTHLLAIGTPAGPYMMADTSRMAADRFLTIHIPSGTRTADRYLTIHIPSGTRTAHRYLLIVHGHLTDASVPGTHLLAIGTPHGS